jgi:hypothetical protein
MMHARQCAPTILAVGDGFKRSACRTGVAPFKGYDGGGLSVISNV